jgi:hypothetical protein
MYTSWIRPSTGHLCIELVSPEFYLPESDLIGLSLSNLRPSRTSLLEPPEASETMALLSLQEYHNICFVHLSRLQIFLIPAYVTVNLGSIRRFTEPEYASSSEIASIPNCGFLDFGWETIEGAWDP